MLARKARFLRLLQLRRPATMDQMGDRRIIEAIDQPGNAERTQRSGKEARRHPYNPPCNAQEFDDPLDAVAPLHVGKHERLAVAHPRGVPFHHNRDHANIGARSRLLMTSRSDLVIPGPPLRGISSPWQTEIT